MRINEVENPLIPDEIIEDLTMNCDKVLLQCKAAGSFLLRGIYSTANVPPYFKAHSPVNRVPSTTAQHDSKYADKLLTQHGFRAIRNNSIFCTGDEQTAWTYTDENVNNIYIIIPTNTANFTWSPRVADMYDLSIEEDSFEVLFNRYIGTYKSTDLDDAIESGAEVMVSGEYYAFKKELYEEFLRDVFL